MIGFGNEYKLFKTDKEGEGADTKNLSKNELYELVAEDYVLPPVSSKSVTREWLLKVRSGEVFRITHLEYKNFEFTLNKSHSRKVGIINNALLVKKLNDLLEDRGEPELGFTEFDLPEQNWLFKIARYIDKTNLLEFFESAPEQEPPLTDSSPLVSRIYYGRLYAGQWLFRLDKIKKNKKLYEGFQALAEKHKYLNSFKINCNVLMEELKDSKKKVAQLEQEMNDMAGKIAFTYTSLEDPKITPELVIAGGDQLTAEMRQCIMQNTQM